MKPNQTYRILDANQPLPSMPDGSYICYVCGVTTRDPHTDHDGNDVCESCCSVCKDEKIADAARNARSVIRKAWALGQEIGLTSDEEDLLLNLLSLLPLLTFDNDPNGPQL